MNPVLSVLIVEVADSGARGLIELLRRCGYEPHARTVTGEDDLAAVLDPAPDLILCNETPCPSGGLEVLRRIRARNPGIPLILVPDTLDRDQAILARQLGAADCVSRDDPERLTLAIEGALERRRLRDDRRRFEAGIGQLAAIVESSNDAIIGRRLDGTITSWNAGAAHMFGYSAEEAIGRPLSMILPPWVPSRTTENNAALATGGRIEPYEAQRITRNGRILEVLVSLSPIRDADGHLTGASSQPSITTSRR